MPTPTQQLAAFLEKYDAKIASFAKGALTRLRKRLPGAAELVYDNYNALGIGFAPQDKVSKVILSIVLYPRWVSLFFLYGAALPDPKKVLKGSGSRVRHIVLKSPADLESREIETLIAAALDLAAWRIDPTQKRQLVIKSVSAKQRPRRPT